MQNSINSEKCHKHTIAIIAILGSMLALGGQNAHAQDYQYFAPINGKAIDAPAAFLAFCSKNPDECKYNNISDSKVQSEITEILTQKMFSSFVDNNFGTSSYSPAANDKDVKQKSDEKELVTKSIYFAFINSNERIINNSFGIQSVSTKSANDNYGQANDNYHKAELEKLEPIRVNQYNFANINYVNNDVNTTIAPVSDYANYGKSDYWALPEREHLKSGDCEDYVLEKRHRLITMGYLPQDLNIVIVKKHNDELHALLLVHTNKGDFVLDNLNNEIKPWYSTNYIWLSRQSPEDPLKWISMDNVG